MHQLKYFSSKGWKTVNLDPKQLFIVGSLCCYQYKIGYEYIGTFIEQCNRPVKFKAANGNMFCHKHWNKTKNGTLSKKAWQHKQKHNYEKTNTNSTSNYTK